MAGLYAQGRGSHGVHRLQSLASSLVVVGVHLQECLEALSGGALVAPPEVFDAECLNGPHVGPGRGETPSRHVLPLGLGDRIPKGVPSHDRRLEMLHPEFRVLGATALEEVCLDATRVLDERDPGEHRLFTKNPFVLHVTEALDAQDPIIHG